MTNVAFSINNAQTKACSNDSDKRNAHSHTPRTAPIFTCVWHRARGIESEFCAESSGVNDHQLCEAKGGKAVKPSMIELDQRRMKGIYYIRLRSPTTCHHHCQLLTRLCSYSCTPSGARMILDLFKYPEQANDQVGAVHNETNHDQTNQRELAVADDTSCLS